MLEREKVNNTGFNIENSYSELPQIFYTKQLPSLSQDPKIVILNKNLAEDLGLNLDILESNEGRYIFSGNKLINNSNPIAQAYAGHQFGYFTMLGDGRAVLLGEHITPKGEKVDIQLKGSGITPYSRGGDGKAALGPMIREYIISEAMYGLGIPTTRSLAVVTTGESVARERVEPGAILTRISSSHIRVGTFQYAARYASYEDLKAYEIGVKNRREESGEYSQYKYANTNERENEDIIYRAPSKEQIEEIRNLIGQSSNI